MTGRRRVVPAIVVEGKYDKIRLENVVDAVILVTGGFRIYHNKDMLSLLRHYAQTTGIVILTDADAAGFQIRGYLKGAILEGRIYHVYVPGIHGKERRKREPSAEGLLGVEGMDDAVLMQALERAGVFAEAPPERPNDITPALLYACGLAGTPDCAAKRQALLSALSLPPHLSIKGLCEVLGTMTCAAELDAFLQAHLPEQPADRQGEAAS